MLSSIDRVVVLAPFFTPLLLLSSCAFTRASNWPVPHPLVTNSLLHHMAGTLLLISGVALLKTHKKNSGLCADFSSCGSTIARLKKKNELQNKKQKKCVDENPWCFAISEFRSTTAAKGMCMIPKRGLNVMKCETARLLKLTSNSVEPLSFVVPRKVCCYISVGSVLRVRPVKQNRTQCVRAVHSELASS